MTRAMHLAIVALVAAAVSCGGSGKTFNNSPPAVTPSFVPDPNAPSAPTPLTVTMSQGPVAGDLVAVRVNVTSTSGVNGAAFDLVCDPADGCVPASVEFVQASPGTLLEQGGNAPTYTATADGVWPVVVGASRTGAGSGVDASTPRMLVSLTFRVKAVGTYKLKVQNAALIDASGHAIPGVTFYAGSLQGS